MTRRGVEQPQIKAEIVVSALLGINLGRALGWFSTLHDVARTELVGLITNLLDGESGSESPSSNLAGGGGQGSSKRQIRRPRTSESVSGRKRHK
jgi:hypothetical protein